MNRPWIMTTGVENDDATFEGKYAFVTGAGRGIGAAIARRLAEMRAHVIVGDVLEGIAFETAAKLRGDGYRATGVKVDVTDRESLLRLAAWCYDNLGPISILVNNAGVAGRKKMDEEGAPEEWDLTILVNLTGSFNATHAFLPALKKTAGVVVNIGSFTGFTSGFGHVAYAASKGGVRSLTQAMCRELAPFGIRVNSVAPGYMEMSMGQVNKDQRPDWVAMHTPMGRHGKAHEIADAVAYLASPRASYISGVSLPVDGGYITV